VTLVAAAVEKKKRRRSSTESLITVAKNIRKDFWDRLTGDQKVELVLWVQAILLTIIAVVCVAIMM
jgi:hypothetical protein